jgi:hypothetical protein
MSLSAAIIYFKKRAIVGCYTMILFILLFVLVPLINSLISYNYVEQEASVLGPITSSQVFLTFSIYCVLTSFIGFIFSLLSVKQSDRCVEVGPFKDSQAKTVLNITALGQLTGALLFLLSTGYDSLNPIIIAQNIILGGRFSYWTNEGHNQLLMTLSHYFNHCCVLYFFYDVRFKSPSWLRTGCVCILVVLMVVLTGARGWLIAAMSGGVMAALMYRKVSMRSSLVLGVSVTCFMIAFQIIRRSWSTEFELDEILVVLIQGDMSYFYFASLEAIRQFDLGAMFYPFNFLKQLVFLPIPHEYTFGLKERDLPMLFESAYHYDFMTREGNFPPGLFGVFVLNFGVLGSVLGPLIYFSFINYVDSANRRRGVILEAFMAIAIMLVLQLFRGAMMGFYFWFFLTIVLFCIKYQIILRRMLTNAANLSRS